MVKKNPVSLLSAQIAMVVSGVLSILAGVFGLSVILKLFDMGSVDITGPFYGVLSLIAVALTLPELGIKQILSLRSYGGLSGTQIATLIVTGFVGVSGLLLLVGVIGRDNPLAFFNAGALAFNGLLIIVEAFR